MGTGVAYFYSLIATILPGIFPASFRDMGGRPAVYFEAAAAIVTAFWAGLANPARFFLQFDTDCQRRRDIPAARCTVNFRRTRNVSLDSFDQIGYRFRQNEMMRPALANERRFFVCNARQTGAATFAKRFVYKATKTTCAPMPQFADIR